MPLLEVGRPARADRRSAEAGCRMRRRGHSIASLKDTVDSFFDDVMVMTDDLQVRDNRLALLGRIAGMFGQFADFSRLAT